MRVACSLIIVALGACTSEHASVVDGQYTGAITSSGCMSGATLSINVMGGKASFASATTMCRTNEATSDGFSYDCTIGGGESHYLCISQGIVHETTDMVQATAVGTDRLSGTITRSSTDYSPPNCVVTSQCSDSGTFEMTLQR